jgi:histidinol-phosphatase (PHP family)
MSYLQNLHTHTTYCDGKDTPEQMVRAAIAQGFDSIGFSEHAPTRSPSTPNEEKLAAYRNEIRTLAREYEGKIDIFCGLEYDFYSEFAPEGFDYLIGSVHYLSCLGISIV